MAKKTTAKTARRANGTILPKAKAAKAKPAAKAAPAKRTGTKGETVLTMIAAAKGATIEALMKATEWQAHTLRAFLSRARANGTKVESERADGVTTYRVAGGKAPAAKPAKVAKAKRAPKGNGRAAETLSQASDALASRLIGG